MPAVVKMASHRDTPAIALHLTVFCKEYSDGIAISS